MKEFLCGSAFFGMFLSVAAFEVGLLLKRKLRLAVFNPLVTSTALVILVLVLFHIDYDTYDKGAQYISYLLTPATICLAIPLYEEVRILKENAAAVFSGILAGSLAAMGSIFLLAGLFFLDHTMYVTLLPKSITTAIGMGLSTELGGYPAITAAAIVLTGIFGNVTAGFACRFFRLRHPVARGIAIGTASHAIGTAKAMEMGEIEGAMSSLSIAIAGVVTVVASNLFALLR